MTDGPAPAASRWRPAPLASLALGGLAAGVVLLAVGLGALLVGPAALPWRGVLGEVANRLPLVHVESTLTETQATILWEIRLPRIVLGGLVGGMLSIGGAAYQGVFRNPLADPYLLGVAAGAGLGATVAIVSGGGTVAGLDLLPLAAFAGGSVAVALAYLVGASVGGGRSTASLLLAGVAVAAFLTATQTYLQQRHADTLRQVYSWILGGLTTSGWAEVRLILPYVAISVVVLLLHRRLLDVFRVGEEEAAALGVAVGRVRLIVVLAATLGTAAVVAVSGLIGFVGIIVPHTVRLLAGASYRRLLPLSLVAGACFLILADLGSRTVAAPAELPIGVITALAGAPFFLLVLRTTRVVST